MQRIVIDTNVIVSALIGSGHPQKIIYNFVLGRKVIVCISAEIFAEYIEVLNRERFSKYPEFLTKAEIVLNKIEELSQNNRFLELAEAADAEFLITGNINDFTMKQFGKTTIVSPEE